MSSRLLEQIGAAEATRFRQGVSIDAGPVVEIGNGARHAQQLKAAACAQAALVDQLFPELECRRLDGSALPQRYWQPQEQGLVAATKVIRAGTPCSSAQADLRCAVL